MYEKYYWKINFRALDHLFSALIFFNWPGCLFSFEITKTSSQSLTQSNIFQVTNIKKLGSPGPKQFLGSVTDPFQNKNQGCRLTGIYLPFVLWPIVEIHWSPNPLFLSTYLLNAPLLEAVFKGGFEHGFFFVSPNITNNYYHREINWTQQDNFEVS